MKQLIIIVAVILTVALVSSVTVFAGTNTTNSGQQLLDESVIRLQKQGVPVQTAQLADDNRFTQGLIAEFTLQSASSNTIGTPDDAIYLNLIGHEVSLALGRGLEISAFLK